MPLNVFSQMMAHIECESCHHEVVVELAALGDRMGKRSSINYAADSVGPDGPACSWSGTRTIRQAEAQTIGLSPQERARRRARIAWRIAADREGITAAVKDLPAARWANRLADILCSRD